MALINVNPKMIVLAREFRGLTQSQLAKSIEGLQQSNLSKIEKGLLSIQEGLLEKIANFLNFPISFFEEEDVKVPINEFYYRKRTSISTKALTLIESKLNLLRKKIDDLLESVDTPEFNIPQYDLSIFDITPSDVARRTRDYLKIASGPIDNPVNVLEKNGVIVYFLDVKEDKFDGITVYTPKNRPIIFVNKHKSNDRKRFTIGHELGHLLMHIPFFVEPNRNVEAEADEFSAEYNMPYLDCRLDLSQIKFNDLSTIKAYWKMSKSFIVRRAKDIGVINESKYVYFNIELSRLGEKKVESGPVISIDNPTLLGKVIKIYKSELDYTEDDISNILNLKISDVRDLFNFDGEPKLRLVS